MKNWYDKVKYQMHDDCLLINLWPSLSKDKITSKIKWNESGTRNIRNYVIIENREKQIPFSYFYMMNEIILNKI